MKLPLCIKCNRRPATIFVSSGQNGEPQKGYCIKCAAELNIGPVNEIIQRMGITPDDIDEVSDQMEELLDTMGDSFEQGGTPVMPLNLNMFSANPGSSPSDRSDGGSGTTHSKDDGSVRSSNRKKGEDKDKKYKFLNLYCTDLTKKARHGEIDRIVGRDEVIYRVTQILCRRTKNNPCLIGEPGVGKTAVAEGLAIKIASGEVPAKLANKEVHLLDLTALVAGTQFRGQFESRIKGLIDEVKSKGNVILFIDEVHNLVGAGDSEGGMNAANILKPALSRGEIQVIGATTFNEYRKHIEKDAALERRFQPVKVEEPSIRDTYEILRGIKDYYEDYHRVRISDALLYSTVTLSERYITDRFLPDKAIDLLDEACTCANLRNRAISEDELNDNELTELREEAKELEVTASNDDDYRRLQEIRSRILVCEAKQTELHARAADNDVTQEDLATVISLWTGIPVRKIVDSDLTRLAELENVLKKRIIGQDEAVEKVCAAVKRTRVRINPVKRPASFIFVGPTGVGKTELVKQLAKELFDSPETLIRLDMSEFMEKFSVSRLIGSPPGYVGYEEAGQLTEKVRRKPYSVILFDEIEKAHPDVMNILLQILDEGKTNDAQGRTVSFENTVIIMTSNAGSAGKDNLMGFGKTTAQASEEKVLKALSDFLRPEFLGRVDEIVVFRPLSHDDYCKIAEVLIDELKPGLKERGIDLHVDNNVYGKLADKAADASKGARELRNEIRRRIEDKIADLIVRTRNAPISDVFVRVNEDEIIVSI